MSGVMINNNLVGLAGFGKGLEVGKALDFWFTCAFNHKKWSGLFIDVPQKYVDSSFLRVKKKKKLAGLLHVGLGFWVCSGFSYLQAESLVPAKQNRAGISGAIGILSSSFPLPFLKMMMMT